MVLRKIPIVVFCLFCACTAGIVVAEDVERPRHIGAPDCGFRPVEAWIEGLDRRLKERGITYPAPELKPHAALRKDGDAGGAAGRVYDRDNIAIVELAADDVIPANLFDLEGKTLRFTREGSGYRTEVLSLQWDASFGTPLDGWPSAAVTLNQFVFPFSGTTWNRLFIGAYGNITFGADQDAIYDPVRDRFLSFQDHGGSFINTIPIISVLFRRLGGAFGFRIDPDNVNQIFFKELSNRAVVTWTISEPYREIQSFTATPKVNRFQAVLQANGTIELSYDRVQVEDGIVGIFTTDAAGTVEELATIVDSQNFALPDYVDIRKVTAALVGDTSIRFTFETRGPILPVGNPIVEGLFYRAWIDLDEPFVGGPDFDDAEFHWFVGGAMNATYFTGGPGVSPEVQIQHNRITLTASLKAFEGRTRFAFFVDVADFDDPAFPFDQTLAVTVNLPETLAPQVDLSALTPADSPRRTVFEAFHYAVIPTVEELGCKVITTLGDRFDFLAFYTDFRIDSQEAGAVSTGPIGDGVTGIIGNGNFRSPESFCSGGQLQVVQFPSYVGAPFCARDGSDFFGDYTNFNRQVGLMSHELGHRWLTVSEASVLGGTVSIGDVHWARELHAPTAFPVAEAVESSPMGGGHWEDNGDGSFTLASNAFFVPATGYSFLDLYLMGLRTRQSVPEFYLLEDRVFLRRDAQGREVSSGTRRNLTVEDVIAANGPRLPAFEDSQRDFNLGVVGIVQSGRAPSATLMERISGIRRAFLDYWPVATGGVSVLTSRTSDPIDEFRRGDANGDGSVDVSDPIVTLNHLFAGAGPLSCDDAGDGNDDGGIDVSDPIFVLQHLFGGGAPIPAPGSESCGTDPTDDELGCAQGHVCG